MESTPTQEGAVQKGDSDAEVKLKDQTTHSKNMEEKEGKKEEKGEDEEEKVEKLKEEEISALKEKLEEEKRRSEDYFTRLKYLQADFENFRKRIDRQMDEIKRQSSERIVLNLLDVVDELEMAIKSASSSGSMEVLISGVEMTLKKLKKILAGEGVSQIECVGKPFDPSLHEVACVVDGDSDGVVLEEVRKGYIMGGRVIRPSVVKISKKSSSKEVDSHE